MNISSVLFTGHDSSFRTGRRSSLPSDSDEERSHSPMPTEHEDTFSIRSAQKKPETYEQSNVEEDSPFAFSAPSPPPSNDQPVQVPEPVLFAEPERPRYNPNKQRPSFAEQLRLQKAEKEALDQLANTSLSGQKADRQESSVRKERKKAAPYIKPPVLKSSKLNPEQLPELSTPSTSSQAHTAFSLPFDNSRRKP